MSVLFLPREKAYEVSPHLFVVDASDLRLPPGAPPPESITTNIGNYLSFNFESRDANGALMYAQVLGCAKLRVLPT